MISFCAYHTQLIKNFAFLVKLRTHFENGYQCRNGSIITFKFFIKNTNSIPKLTILYIFHDIKCFLISIETFLKIFNKQIAVTKSCPCRSILRVNWDNLTIKFYGLLVISWCCALLSIFIYLFNLFKIVCLVDVAKFFNTLLIFLSYSFLFIFFNFFFVCSLLLITQLI